MSSFWNMICFPRRRFSSGQSKNKQRQRRRNKGNVVTLQRRKLLDDTGHFQDTQSVTANEATQPTEKPPQNDVPNKRRRIQDIFNTDPHSPALRDSEQSSFDPYEHKHSDNFTHMKVPSLFIDNNRPKRPHSDVNNVESMYGYVPKTMQNLYTSTALEGQKIEDYFSSLHNDIYFSKFANSEAVTKDKTESILQRVPFTRASSLSSAPEEKVSLLEENYPDTEMDIGQFNDVNQWENPLAPRTEYNMEEKFRSIFNSVEEVLY
ncbi:uncharacterized protein [Mytilus edulis]